ncbi:MAG: class I SAM-dependent methyltransferase [Cyanobacteriota bacterium]|nr:class I SAM-dependent methyltransferase [Cyanobacteriota bacterium]
MLSAQKWDVWNESGGPKYPYEKVVQFCFRNYPSSEQRKETKVLDLGCGSGVNCLFLAKEGFQVTGTDISKVGITNTKQKLDELHLQADLRVEEADILNFAENLFNLVICVGVYDSTGPEVAKTSIERIAYILANKGKGIFIFASNRDFRIKEENPLELYGYSQKEVENIFLGKFSQVYFDRYITTYQSQKFEQNDWLITVEK